MTNFSQIGTLYFRKNTYMWDASEFYDDLEHSIFKNNAYMSDQSVLMTLFQSLEQRMHGYSTNCYDESFFTKFARK
jgi:hypothetical protein